MLILSFLLLTSSSLTVTQIPAQGYPSTSTIGSVLLLLEDCLYTFGGSSMPEVSKDFKRFNLTTLTWSEILPSSEDSPSMRSNSLGFSYNRKLFILGGKSESLILFDLWSFDLESNSWSLVKTEGLVPVARLKSLTCVENDFLYLFGGETVQGNDLKLYKLDLLLFEWSVVTELTELKSFTTGFMFSFNQNLYIFSSKDKKLFLFDLQSNLLSQVQITGDLPSSSQYFALFNENLYIFPSSSNKALKTCTIISLHSQISKSHSFSMTSDFNTFTQSNSSLFLFSELFSDTISNRLCEITKNDLKLKTISEDVSYPKARAFHSLEKCRKYLWLYGGCAFESYFSDSWKFDIQSEKWEIITKTTGKPMGRCAHSVLPLFGDSFVVFGGKNSDIYLNDAYIYNFLSNSWTAIGQDLRMPGRSSACLCLAYPIIFVHGGINSEGVLADLWKISLLDSSFTEIKLVGMAPALHGHQCGFESGGTSYIIVYTGTNSKQTLNFYTYRINVESGIVEIVENNPAFAISYTKVINMTNFSVLIGGFDMQSASKDLQILYKNKSISTFSLPTSLAGHGAVHSGRSLYIHGGVFSVDSIIIPKKGSNLLLKISSEEFDCSGGFSGSNCEICAKGSYSESLNSKTCSNCSKGTYSSEVGLTFPNQCLPCPYGTFQDEEGQSSCYDCNPASDCRFKTTHPRTRKNPESVSSIQPSEYDSKEDQASFSSSILVYSIISIISIVSVFYLIRPKNRIFLKIDLFKNRHEKKETREAQATTYGGFFSCVFLLIAVIFICSPVIFYRVSNVSETKKLIPSLTMQNKRFVAEKCLIKTTLFDFAGTCVVNSECNSIFYGGYGGATAESSEGPICEVEGDNCIISYTLFNVEFSETGFLNMTVIDVQVYSTGIQAEITISSSLPGKNNESFISFYLEPPTNYAINGAKPSYIYINLIPSVKNKQVFFTDSSKWKDDVTGYHLTYPKMPEIGEYSDSKRFSIVIQKTTNVIVIERLEKITLINLLSGILGSIAGLLELVGGFMEVSEKKIERVKMFLRNRGFVKKLKKKRVNYIENQLFAGSEIRNYLGREKESLDQTFDMKNLIGDTG